MSLSSRRKQKNRWTFIGLLFVSVVFYVLVFIRMGG